MSREKESSEKLKKFSQDLGISLFGIADVTGIREEFYLDKGLASKFDWGISMGKRLIDSVLDDIKDRPTTAIRIVMEGRWSDKKSQKIDSTFLLKEPGSYRFERQ